MASIPDKIGKYKVLELLARGGMGAVYRGVHPTLDRPVILKKLTLRGNPDFVERFRREARILMDFRNDNIVDVYDHFKEGRSHYIVLEYIDGLSVEQLIRRERYLPDGMAMYILYQTCKALKYAHSRNVIHRDIKPSNVLLSKKGEVKLLDFGIAASDEDAESGLTREGMTLGSPAYMAPEQFENTRNVDRRADIYSVGVMLYEMVTGKKPYPGGFSADLIAAIQKGKYPPPRTYNPAIGPMIRKIIRKCMHPKPKRRYQDLDELLYLLRRFFRRSDPGAYRLQLKNAVAGGKLEPLRLRRKRNLSQWIAATVLVLVLLGGTAGLLYRQGYYHELLHPDTHGAVNFEVLLNEPYKPTEDYYIMGYLFTDTGDNAEELDMSALDFHPVVGDEGEALKFETGRIFLEEDEYRIKVQIENALYWKSFYLHPRTKQKQQINTSDALVLEFPFVPPREMPLEVHFYIQDRSNWEDITEETTIELLDGEKWREWNTFLTSSLLTDRVYKFRFSAEGYGTKIFSLMIRPEQTSLYLNPRLIPEDESGAADRP